MIEPDKTTHFGFETVTPQEKTTRVLEVFHSVASQYDLMNDLMSLGIHRLWKRTAINLCALRPGQRVLDLAGGTGDLTTKIAPLVGNQGEVVLADINSSMLSGAWERLLDRGIFNSVKLVQANAESLPFVDDYFDCIIIGFGLRNVTDKDRALQSMYRVLKPGGRLIVLEFSHPTTTVIKKFYDAYSFKLLPWIGKMVADDEDAYRYLVESIRMHPDQETLKNMLLSAGFDQCDYHNLSGGIVALHRGFKY